MSADNTEFSSLITCVVTTLRGISIPISWGQFFLFQVNVFSPPPTFCFNKTEKISEH